MEYLNYVNIEIGNRIREIRLLKGLTQMELGNICNIDPSTISRLEEGKRSATTITLFKLADCLGVQLADIVDIRNEYFEEHTDEFLISECVKLLKKLDSEEQDTALSMLRMFVSMKRKANASPPKRDKND